MEIKWIRAHGKEARYQSIEKFLGWIIYRLASGDRNLFDRYYAESTKLGQHAIAENTEDEIKEAIRRKELNY